MSNVSKGQIQLPGEFRPGEPIRAGEMDRLRKAIAFVMKDMIGSGRGITITQSAGKYLISARKQRGGASGENYPWKVKIENNESRQVTLTPGAVNNTIPLIGSARMIISPRPVLTLPNVAIVGIYLKITVDGSMESTAVEVIAAGIDTVWNSLDLQTGGIGYELIASFTIEDGAIVSHQQFVKTKLYHRAYLKHIFWT